MSNTKIKMGADARKSLQEGVDLVANAVKTSLGSSGRNSIIPTDMGGFAISKDGISIAKAINPENIYHAIGASLIKEAAAKTNIESADGTTSSTVLAQAIFNEGLKLVNKGHSPVELKKGIDVAVEDVKEYLKGVSKEVNKDNLKDITTISANGDGELGKIISEAFTKIGINGRVIATASDTHETSIDIKDGLQLDKGYMNSIFRTDSIKELCKLDNPLVLLHKGKLEKSSHITKVLELVAKSPKNKLLIITDSLNPFVGSTIGQNVKSGVLAHRICIVGLPQILKINVDLLNDLATLTGSVIVSEEAGTKPEFKNLGRIDQCVITDKDTLLIGANKGLDELVDNINKKIEITTDRFEKEELRDRIAFLTGGIAELKVGAKSDSELAEKLYRVEDAIGATRSALMGGIVSGGGVAIADAADKLFQKYDVSWITGIINIFKRMVGIKVESSFDLGYKLLLNSCTQPFKQILSNADIKSTQFLNEGEGIDARTGKKVNMIEAGIIDPAMVVSSSLSNAGSVAGTFLTTECIIAR